MKKVINFGFLKKVYAFTYKYIYLLLNESDDFVLKWNGITRVGFKPLESTSRR